MSGSNRDKGTPLVDWGLPLLGIVIALFLVGGLSWLDGREAERRYQSPHRHAESAKASAQRACARLDPDAAFECVYEKVEASENTAQTEQDLSAQQRAATSALASAIVVLFGLIATIVGVWFVKRTLDATLEAVKDTGLATKAMERQNELAETASRPWLTLELEHGFCTESADLLFFANLKITNIGGSPAQNVTVETSGVPDVIRNEFGDLFIISENLADQFSTLEHMVVFPSSTETDQAIFSASFNEIGAGFVAYPDILIVVNYRLGNGLAAQTSARFMARHGDDHSEIFRGQPLPDDFKFIRTGYIRVT